jgi:DNA-directed RNA polymerase subunit alpha
MKWKNLTMPKQLVPDSGNTGSYGKFTIEPLERGFGLTLGNALRRVLLSSLQGAAITAVRIDGVLHEFSTLPGVIVASLNKDGDLRMEVEIDSGRGYVSADQHSQTDRPIGVIPIDSLFSPVLKVNYNVETTRLGQRIDYDKLTFEVWTDGSILPSDAVAVAAKILRDHFTLFIHFEVPIE